MGPPKPPPSTVTSGLGSSASYAQVAAKAASKDQGKRTSEQDRSRDSKVCTMIVKVQWGLYVFIVNLSGGILRREIFF